MNLTLLTAGFPPDFDAIGEYSWWLSRELATQGHVVTVLTLPGGDRSPPPGVQLSSYSPHLLGSLALQDWLIVQYNPFAFGQWGYCPWLMKALREIKQAGRCKVAVMFHEVFTDDPGLRPAAMRLWQAPQARALAAIADRVFVSCEVYGRMLRLSPSEFLTLPIGPNLPEPSPFPAPVSTRLKLGAFATSHASHQIALMAHTLRAVLAAGIDAEFLFIGSGGETAAPHFTGLPFSASGRVPAATASQFLSTIDCLLCPFSDGLSTRRGSAIAGLQHSRPIISTSGPRTDSLLTGQNGHSLHLIPVGQDELFARRTIDLCRDGSARQSMGREARLFFDRAFAWPVVAKSMTGYLQP